MLKQIDRIDDYMKEYEAMMAADTMEPPKYVV